MSVFVVVGAGPVGRETARLLAADGHEVRLVSRSGTAPGGSVVGIALDARDGQGLVRIGAGAEAIFMCAMPLYTRWPTDFPPIMEGVAAAADDLQARLIVLGNVYGYGSGAKSPLTSTAPLAPTSVKGNVRAAMWERALSANIPALEIRASDYLGNGAGSLFTLMTLPPLLAGRPAMVSGDLDALHAWTFTKDVARTLVAASRYRGEWGRAFLVPSQHASIRNLAVRFAELAGLPDPELQALSEEDLDALGRDDELMRELPEMAYLFRRPLILDASDTERVLGVSASSLDTMIDDTLRKD
ncbi:NAD-dependent epimerase/dehydratase family protein [Mesorhizobium sp. M1C.F.Ca.ET.193.01.1.1]|uniref:NAD-dependent epimerase/dehydratase family protein n=1 Tax=unclassified Mesorhizobium TaxID=325217 RepID=UPI000FD3B438|nr:MULTISPECIES: NAD-dependent epimerase/dehydratase family protein [unclassified Mesorhizobium]TGS97166.1 NAD-dependent epimerase/dehydratase family protein [bacterium M00.F.Ca.ET.177.01.1.1]TGQ52327.1 NAD-dependent epimerase/dehydratase family protein [Mesorhizobium sp. M1C.F.Ca.ET.210.01.1.1]TGQ68957.1 NAD-dependent epimerase/dehydratase family protein [Mesorhizobium sp. M1C.F.Ca.ET.212.01.1.1]TGR04510.1 NAD-dependent epimerase/dehydratase family protein [Mesorhizobium sp. M1C.F.Ca.ET.204.01